MAEPVLVGDIGGTNARFAIAECDDAHILVRDMHTFRAVDFESIRDAADAFLESVADKPVRACFAAAGPLIEDTVKFTNSHWVLRGADISGPLKLEQFRIVNDFFALALGVSKLDQSGFITVKEGTPKSDAPSLVIGPGTGLGQAIIVPTANGSQVVSTEGGHVLFAPVSDTELEILKFIAREHPRVSVERLLSGRGLVNIHRALCAIEGAQRVSLQANEITEAAITGEFPIAVRAVDTFCCILGSVVGDAVLSTGARGGVFLGGGILPRIQEIFLKSGFVERFIHQGRMSDYISEVPVQMIAAEGPALYGAAAALEIGQ